MADLAIGASCNSLGDQVAADGFKVEGHLASLSLAAQSGHIHGPSMLLEKRLQPCFLATVAGFLLVASGSWCSHLQQSIQYSGQIFPLPLALLMAAPEMVLQSGTMFCRRSRFYGIFL